MTDAGVATTNLDSSSLIDEVLGNRVDGGTSRTVRVAIGYFIQQLVALITVSAVGGQSYPTTSAGLAGTSEGGYFTVPEGGDGGLRLYRVVSGAAVQVARVLGKADLDAAFGTLKALAYRDDVGTNQITDGAVTSAKLGAAAVTEAKLGDGAVTGQKLGAAAVTTAKMADKAVTYAKMQDVTAGRLLGRRPGTAGPVQEIAPEDARDDLGVPSTTEVAEAIAGAVADEAEARSAEIVDAVGYRVLDEEIHDAVLDASGRPLVALRLDGTTRAHDTCRILDERIRDGSLYAGGGVMDGVEHDGVPYPPTDPLVPRYEQLLDERYAVVPDTYAGGRPARALRHDRTREADDEVGILDEYYARADLYRSLAPHMQRVIRGMTHDVRHVGGDPTTPVDAWTDPLTGEVIARINGRRVPLSWDTPEGTRNINPHVADGGEVVRWMVDDGARVMDAQQYVVPISGLTIPGAIRHILVAGHSHAYGTGSVRVHSGAVAAGVAQMFNVGPRVTGDNNDASAPVPAENMACYTDLAETSSAEGPAVSIGIGMTTPALGGSLSRPALVTTAAIGGAAIEDMIPGGPVYELAIKAARRARIVSARIDRDHLTPWVVSVFRPQAPWTQTQAQFSQLIRDHYDGYVDDLGWDDADPFRMFIPMFCAWTAYKLRYCNIGFGQLIEALYPRSSGSLKTISGTAGKEAAIEIVAGDTVLSGRYQRRIHCTGPTYHLERIADGAHFTGASTSYYGQQIAWAINSVINTGDWLPLHFNGRSIDGTHLIYHYVPPSDDLSINTTDVSEAANKGVSWVQSAGSARAITAVEVTGNDLIVTFDGAISGGVAGTLGIATMGPDVDYSTAVPAGPVTGARSNLCSRTGVAIDDGREMIHWACPQEDIIIT